MKTNKLMITCALCGGGTTRKQSPYVPLTPEELVADSLAAVRAGACILHIHVRDDEGANTMETSRFVQVVSMIREALRTNHLDAIINVTTYGTKFSEDMRVAHLPILMPEMCSYDPGTLNWANSYIFLNTPPFLERLGLLTQELDIKPELSYDLAGSLSLIGVNRGRKKALKSIVKSFKENYELDPSLPLAIVSSDAEKDADWLEGAVRKEPGCEDLTILRGSVGPTIGAHVGPGMVALIFWGKNRADKISLTDRIANRVRGE